MKTIKLLLAIILSATLMCGCNGNKQEKNELSSSSVTNAIQEDEISTDDVVSTSQETKTTLDDKIEVLDFFATWCGPCKAMAPAMEKMEKKYGDKIDFRKIDIDQELQLAQEYDISAVPTLVILSPQGDVVDKIVGGQPEEELDRIFGGL